MNATETLLITFGFIAGITASVWVYAIFIVP